MSKTPAIDAKTMHGLDADGADWKNRAALQDNPLAALVEEFQEFGDIAVSPSFKPLKSEANESVGSPQDADRLSEPSAEQTTDETVNVETSQPEPGSHQQSVLPTAMPSETPKDLSATPQKSAYRITTEPSADPLAIPSSKGEMGKEAPGIGLTSVVKRTPKKRRSMRGLAMAAAALITVAGAGYLYVQGTQTASSDTVVYSVPVFDDDNAATTQAAQPKPIEEKAVDKSMDVAEYSPPSTILPVSVTPVAPKPLGFNDSLSDEFPALEGQSLLDLATGVPTYTPSDIVPDSEWQDVSCGGCHSFDQADLCKQGAYYFNLDKALVNRIQHPYGGGFKQKLMDWAEAGCN